MSIVDWFADIIDSFFIESELVDLNMSEAELCERDSFDSLADYYVRNYTDDDTPTGKKVL